MSTTGRGRRRPRGGAAGDGRLSPRGVRMRNACVRHAADRLGLERPDEQDLRSLRDDTSLREAIEWWQDRAAAATAESSARSARAPLVRAAVVTAVTVLGLALSYGRAQ